MQADKATTICATRIAHIVLNQETTRVYGRAHIKRILALCAIKQRNARKILTRFLIEIEQYRVDHVISVQIGASDVELPAHATAVMSSEQFNELLIRCIEFESPRSLQLTTQSQTEDVLRTTRLLSYAGDVVAGDRCLIVLLAGSSGTGKSTLASLLAERLGVDTVISTDVIRHALRQRITRDECPVLHRSSYETHECIEIDPTSSSSTTSEAPDVSFDTSIITPSYVRSFSRASEDSSPLSRVLLGHSLQSMLVCAHVMPLIRSLGAARVSAIVEGVHLTPRFVRSLLADESLSSVALIAPFFVFISNPGKHQNRFAVRSETNSIRQADNSYIASFPFIREIQSALLHESETSMPVVDNTNIDRSVALVHELITHAAVQNSSGTGVNRSSWWTAEANEAKHRAWSSKAMQRVLAEKSKLRRIRSQPIPDSVNDAGDSDVDVEAEVDADGSTSAGFASLVAASHDYDNSSESEANVWQTNDRRRFSRQSSYDIAG